MDRVPSHLRWDAFRWCTQWDYVNLMMSQPKTGHLYEVSSSEEIYAAEGMFRALLKTGAPVHYNGNNEPMIKVAVPRWANVQSI